MTSKNLYSKLMREDLKSRIWAVALIGLVFFFAFPVVAAFMADSIQDAPNYEKAVREYAESMKSWLSFSSGLTVFLMMGMALICGMSSFSYLNARNKVDFYHSIPVRREKLYIANYLCGILIVAIPYAVMLFLGAVIAVSNGVSAAEICRIALEAYGLSMVYFILMYSVVIVAVMMTGNLIVSFLGVMVFSWVAPIAVMLTAAYHGAFFRTCLSWRYDNWVNWSGHLSPILEYVLQVGNYEGDGVSAVSVVTALAVSALLAVLGAFLYRIRPSEAAGRAMAFRQTRPVIRAILTVIAALGMGIFFWSARYSTGWAVFGILCGGVIAHCVIEIIYHFDFKKLFANSLHLAGCLVVSLLVLLVFRYDWVGYDRYLPEAGKVKEAAVNVSVLTDWASYGGTVQTKDGTYRWESSGSSEYVFDHMKLQDIQVVLDLAQAGIAEHEAQEQAGYAHGYVAARDGEQFTSVEICYTLNSGRQIYRNYWMPVGKNQALFDALDASEGYKAGLYPVMSLTPERIAEVRYRELYPEIRLNQMTMEEKAELLTAYQQDLKELTLEQMAEQVPVGLLRFVRQEDADGIAWRERQEALARQNNTYFHDYSDIYERDFYPVYPSFGRTNQVLAKYGIEPGDDLEGLTIQSINVTYYEQNSNYTADAIQIAIDDPEEIQELAAVVKPRNFNYYNRMFQMEEYWDGDILFKGQDAKSQYISVAFPKGQVPDFLKERLTKDGVAQ